VPSKVPEIWVGGGSERAIRRARELGDVWHPSRGVTPERVREVRQRFPDLRVVPRTTADYADVFRDAGCEGVVLSFGNEPKRIVAAMREFGPP
jgi:alkanesulfonate monooxygenase SsuD/methylene tetrahydromethanopterin reductase-like flavin-dependent oxidoreductase (luciferase family)